MNGHDTTGADADRLSATLAGQVEERLRSLGDRVRTFGDALERFSDRLSGMLSSEGGSSSGTAGPALLSGGGIVPVRIVNDRGSPVPVVVLNERRESGGGLTGILGGIGSFFGNLVGGFFGGLAAPVLTVVALGELLAAIATAIPLAIEIRRVVEAIDRLMHGLFNELHRAGILPATRLVALALILVETVIRIALFYVQSIINWTVELVNTLAAWLGNFINAASTYLAGVLNALPAFLTQLVTYLVESTLRPAVDTLARDLARSLFSALIGAGAIVVFMLKAVFEFAADHLEHAMTGATNSLISAINSAFGTSMPLIATSPVAPLAGRLERAITEGQAFADSTARTLVPPRTEGAGGDESTAPSEPRFRPPAFRAPELNLPEYPSPGSALDEIFRTGERPAPGTHAPAREESEPEARRETPPQVTLNGGINVQIQAQTVDERNAEATGRAVAAQIYDELRRLIEMDRFRRGLSTGALT